MFNDCDDDTSDWALSTVRLWMPQPAYDEVTPLESWPDVPATYLLGTRDRIINQEWARAAVSSRLGGPPVELDTGHCPQNSNPAPVAHLFEPDNDPHHAPSIGRSLQRHGVGDNDDVLLDPGATRYKL
jgi:hypothetical protein